MNFSHVLLRALPSREFPRLSEPARPFTPRDLQY